MAGQSAFGSERRPQRPRAAFLGIAVCALCCCAAVWRAVVSPRAIITASGDVVKQVAEVMPHSGTGLQPAHEVETARRRVATVAMETTRKKALGKYALGRNDCTNFVARAVERGAGIALPNHDFDRLGNQELQYFTYFLLPTDGNGATVQPGDIVWLIPRKGISHVGVVGTDGRVYHFTKLRRRPQRYAAEPLSVFLRHFACGLQECVVFRLERLPK